MGLVVASLASFLRKVAVVLYNAGWIDTGNEPPLTTLTDAGPKLSHTKKTWGLKGFGG